MSFQKLANTRFSVRKYKNTPVERDKILRCLEASRLTPSACNSQPWHFVVVDNPEEVVVLAEKTTLPLTKLNQFVKGSPVIIAIVAERPNLSAGLGGMIKQKPYYLMDIGMAAEHFCLQAVEEGLGTCMLGWFNEKAVKEYLSVPAKKSIPLLITLGYPDKEVSPAKNRAKLEDIYSFSKYFGQK
ncbi:MAG: nitroreductase family protein [Spirochaetia bacterium]|jgi:nitroreductase|nr:nitroreductase family protein [Spirochaetia bacterium]